MIPLLDWIPQQILDWIPKRTLVTALGLSTVISIGSLVLAPLAIARLPSDYFVEDRPSQKPAWATGPRQIAHFAFTALKNALGVGLIILGAALFVLPGQGLLTIAVGVSLLDFPGKHRLVNAFVRQPLVLNALNWVRAKAHTPPFIDPAAA